MAKKVPATGIFKIVRSDGLQANGKGYFSVKGKAWNSLHHVKAHLRYGNRKYDDCTIVEFELVPTRSIDIATLRSEIREADAARDRERKESSQRYNERQERLELERLKQKHGEK